MRKLKAGDHLVVNIDSLGLTKHHGLCIGKDEVIHLGKLGIVELISFIEFAQGQQIRVKDIACCTPTAIERAKSQLGKHPYHLICGNCEHFVTWCLTGDAYSEQVSNSVHIISQAAARSGLIGQVMSKTATSTAANIALLSTAAKVTGEYLNLPQPVNQLLGTPGDLIAKPLESVIQGSVKTIQDTVSQIHNGEYFEASKSFTQGIIATSVNAAIVKPIEVVGNGLIVAADIYRDVWWWLRN